MRLEEIAHQATAEGHMVVADERLRAQQFQRIRRSALRRRDQHERLALDPLRGEPARQVERRADEDRQVQFGGVHLVQQVQRDARHHLRLDVWRLFGEALEHLRQQPGLRRVHRTDA